MNTNTPEWIDVWHDRLLFLFLLTAPIPIWWDGTLPLVVQVSFLIPSVLQGMRSLGWVPVLDFGDVIEAMGAIFIFVGIALFQFAGFFTLLQAGALFLAVMISLRVWTRQKLRDDAQLYALVFLAFAIGSLLEKGVEFAFVFFAFSLITIFLLGLFHLRSARQRRLGAGSVQAGAKRTYLTGLSVIFALVVVGAAAFFVVIPRMGAGFLHSNTRIEHTIPGFNDRVTLQTHGIDRDNPDVVMRVEFPEERPNNLARLHWRVTAFDTFNGESWSRQKGTEAAERYPNLPSEPPAGTEMMKAKIYLEPISVNYLPYIWPGRYIRIDSDSLPGDYFQNRAQMDLRRDDYGNLLLKDNEDDGLSYEIGWQKTTTDSVRDAEPLVGEDRRQYLQLPELSPDVKDLANRIFKGMETPEQKVEAVNEFLSENFEYTLDSPKGEPTKDLTDFLLERRRGHCEYFATAAAVMLRLGGVPVRLVNGFLGGRWNDSGGYLLVRQGDAHSWLEVYLPQKGWRTVDPTPAASIKPMIPQSFVELFRNTYDSMRFFWHKWVVDFDLASQSDLLTDILWTVGVRWQNLESDETQKSHSTGTKWSVAGKWIWLLVILGVHVVLYRWRVWLSRNHLLRAISTFLLSGGVVLWGIRYASVDESALYLGGVVLFVGHFTALGPAVGLFSSRRDTLIKLLDRVERLGSKEGIERRQSESVSAFVQRFCERRPDLHSELESFRGLYCRIQFSSEMLTSESVSKLREVVTRLEQGFHSELSE